MWLRKSGHVVGLNSIAWLREEAILEAARPAYEGRCTICPKLHGKRPFIWLLPFEPILKEGYAGRKYRMSLTKDADKK